jgi:hypothetical protein
VNGFALWDAVSYLSLGREPPPSTVQSMAANIVASYAVRWPSAARTAITPAALLAALAPAAHGGVTSARPALLAYTLDRMGDAATGTADEVLSAAVGAALGKLMAESQRDTVVALTALDPIERRVLRAVATGGYTCGELEAVRTGQGKEQFKEGSVGVLAVQLAALISCLREAGAGDDILRLQPPYSALLESWVHPSGALAVRVHNDRLDLDYATRKSLVFIGEQRRAVSARLQAAVSKAVLASLARNGVGVWQPSGSVRPPTSAAEFDAVPALKGLRSTLSANYLQGIGREPSLSKALSKADAAQGAPAPAAMQPTARFEETVGWQLLLAFRHFESHSWGDAPQLVHGGLTAAVVADVVRSAASILAEPEGGCFMWHPTDLELLTVRSSP